MRFFSLLIGVFIFCTSHAQDSTVTIPNRVARYFLEQNDRAILLEKQVKIKDEIISTSGKILNTKDSIITTYKLDSTAYNNIILINNQQLFQKQDQLQKAEKEIRRQKRLKYLALIGAGLTVILSIL